MKYGACVVILCLAIAVASPAVGSEKNALRGEGDSPLGPSEVKELDMAIRAFRSPETRTSEGKGPLALARLLNRAAVTKLQEQLRGDVTNMICSLAEDILNNKTYVRFSPTVSDSSPDPKTGLPVYDPGLVVLRNAMYAVTKLSPWNERVKAVALQFFTLTNTPESGSYSLSVRVEILRNYLTGVQDGGYPETAWKDAEFLRNEVARLPAGQFGPERNLWIRWEISTQVFNSAFFRKALSEMEKLVAGKMLAICDEQAGNFRAVVWGEALAEKYPPDKDEVALFASACGESADAGQKAVLYYLMLGYLNQWLQANKPHGRLPEYYALAGKMGRQVLDGGTLAIKQQEYVSAWQKTYCKWTVKRLLEQNQGEAIEKMASDESEPQWIRDMAKAALLENKQGSR